MTNQEILNTVYEHLKQQGKPSRDGSNCRYRASDGSRCAVGCLISDEHYTRELEGGTCRDLDVQSALLKSGVKEHSFELLGILQSFHDMALPLSGLNEASEKILKQMIAEHGVTLETE